MTISAWREAIVGTAALALFFGLIAAIYLTLLAAIIAPACLLAWAGLTHEAIVAGAVGVGVDLLIIDTLVRWIREEVVFFVRNPGYFYGVPYDEFGPG